MCQIFHKHFSITCHGKVSWGSLRKSHWTDPIEQVSLLSTVNRNRSNPKVVAFSSVFENWMIDKVKEPGNNVMC
jgi:hypothetical protein